MTARELAAVMRARKHGNYWLARCPVHDDRSPSVGIREGESGVLLKCFAGCDTRDLLSALGLTFRDIGSKSEPNWKQRVRTASVRPPGERKPLGKLEATYRYTNERGDVVAEKIRFEGKVFLWRRPQAGGGWLWKVDRDNLPLYRLHEVAKARSVILVEGEKDADRLAPLLKDGFAVTTAPNGAKSWKAGYCQWFAGKRVWIIPDSDSPGRAYAQQAGKDAVLHAERVKIIHLPDCKDVSEYLDRHSKDELGTLMRIG